MGLMDELRKLTKPYSEDELNEYDEFDDEEELDGSSESAPRRDSYSPQEGAASNPTPRRTGPAKVVNLNNNTTMQVVLVKPDRYENVREIADHLRDKKTVVLNLESTNKDVARRLVDFLSGVTYSIDGKIKKVAISTYILTPFNVEIIGDLVEELETAGTYF
ncbi:MAG: cell division protein SepF [Oscillospiraceae bacterium]|nr:cell division protein SepF [Oscillospiraceae bacterium]